MNAADSLPGGSPARPPPGHVKCPRCGRPTQWQDNPWRPFCSERCKITDLAAWAEGEYAVPGEEVPTEDKEE
jgi:hypothetical protein